jgi:hypothetical protein
MAEHSVEYETVNIFLHFTIFFLKQQRQYK